MEPKLRHHSLTDVYKSTLYSQNVNRAVCATWMLPFLGLNHQLYSFAHCSRSTIACTSCSLEHDTFATMTSRSFSSRISLCCSIEGLICSPSSDVANISDARLGVRAGAAVFAEAVERASSRVVLPTRADVAAGSSPNLVLATAALVPQPSYCLRRERGSSSRT